MRIVVIGATGHVGTWLVPRLVEEGHTVIAVARGERGPYQDPGIWRFVERVAADRAAEEKAGTFGRRIAALAPDIVVDMICFTAESARHIVDSLRGRVAHYLACGTIWVHGPSEIVPTTEEMPRRPFGDYGVNKAAMEDYLLSAARRDGFPATLVHPGHIVGPGWAPLNPAGHFNPGVFTTLARGGRLCLPNLGMETVHHVHADDVAQVFCRAIACRSAAVGESFNAVSPAAMTLRGYAERMYRWFGRDPDLAFLPWESWKKTVSPEEAAATWDHIAHSPCGSIAKAVRLLGYAPRYGSLEAVCESVEWLVRNGAVEVPTRGGAA
jgi:nucleoside-diphosphate-sugar epimerase